MMLMKWTDVEPGDKVKITKEAMTAFRGEGWIEEFSGILKVKQIKIVGHRIEFYFNDYDYIFTDSDGKYLGTTIFEIVELRKEK